MFEDQVVVVTGGAGVLGQAVVQHFLARGAVVVSVDYNQALVDAAFPNPGPHCHLAVCDLTSRDDCAALSEGLLQTHGAVDVLCNIAGGFQMGETVFETLDETWDFLFNLNTKSIIYMTQKIVPAMVAAGCGKVVNVGAVAATQGQAHMGAYLASKSATIRLTESLAEEVKQAGVNVNCVLPAVIDTPRNRSDMPDADFGQWVAPEHLAAVIGFLASAEAIAVHGAAIPVRGLGG